MLQQAPARFCRVKRTVQASSSFCRKPILIRASKKKSLPPQFTISHLPHPLLTFPTRRTSYLPLQLPILDTVPAKLRSKHLQPSAHHSIGPTSKHRGDPIPRLHNETQPHRHRHLRRPYDARREGAVVETNVECEDPEGVSPCTTSKFTSGIQLPTPLSSPPIASALCLSRLALLLHLSLYLYTPCFSTLLRLLALHKPSPPPHAIAPLLPTPLTLTLATSSTSPTQPTTSSQTPPPPSAPATSSKWHPNPTADISNTWSRRLYRPGACPSTRDPLS